MSRIQIDQLRNAVQEYLRKNSFSGHDFAHAQRVHAVCCRLIELEQRPVNRTVLEAAAYLHDIAREEERKNPKVNHAQRGAEMAQDILSRLGFSTEDIEAICSVIRVHRFSSGIRPETIEAQLLQDADRIDICGAIGIATAFAYGGAHDRILYHHEDPLAHQRTFNDKVYTLDHFYTKLLRVPETLHTASAKKLVAKRIAFMKNFLDQFQYEIET